MSSDLCLYCSFGIKFLFSWPGELLFILNSQLGIASSRSFLNICVPRMYLQSILCMSLGSASNALAILKLPLAYCQTLVLVLSKYLLNDKYMKYNF